MTIKELKEKLDQFPDDFIVMIPNDRLQYDPNSLWNVPWNVPATNVSIGCNEADGCVYIDAYEEDEE